MHKSVYVKTIPRFETIKDMRLDSIFISSRAVDTFDFINFRKELPTTKVYCDVNCFLDETLLEKFPDAKPAEASGKDTGGFLCPTHAGLREYILDNIRKVLSYDIDGIWLSNISYPTKWEMPDPEILDTCYCSRCLSQFEDYIGEEIAGVGGQGTELENKALYIDGSYYHEWLEFKTNVIASFVKDVQAVITSHGKANFKLGLFVVPWVEKEYGAAITRILGQDFIKLANYSDIISPMLYYKTLSEDVTWVEKKLHEFWQFGITLFPILDTRGAESVEEFSQAVNFATKKPSIGVCIYSLNEMEPSQQLINAYSVLN